MGNTVIFTKNGEPEGASVMDKDQISKLRGKTFQSGSDKIGIVDTGVLSEEGLNNSDYSTLARELGTVVATALREHGDEIAFMSARNVTPEGCTIHVQYKADDLGETWEDDFTFSWSEDGKIQMDGHDVASMQQQSGKIQVQKDIAVDNILKYIESKENPETVTEEWPSDRLYQDRSGQVDMLLEKDLILGFKQAVKEYQEDPKNPEKIKELFRRSRGFEGDDLPHKFKNAVDSYKSTSLEQDQPDSLVQGEDIPDNLKIAVKMPSDEVPLEQPVENQPECTSGGFICLNVSLLLRLLEYAKEEAGEDIDLHYISEKAEELSKEGRGLTVADYDTLISASGENTTSSESEEEVNENWFDPSEDEIEDIRKGAYDYKDYIPKEGEVNEISSDLLDKAADSAKEKKRYKQFSKFDGAADDRRKEELGIDSILGMYIHPTKHRCSIKDGNRRLDVYADGTIRNLEDNTHYGDPNRTVISWPLDAEYKLSSKNAKILARLLVKWCQKYMQPEAKNRLEGCTDWHNWVEL